MTTSGPQADPDDDREHRSIGQRIRDAVMGDPVETRRDRDAAYMDDRVVERSGDRPDRGPDTEYAAGGAADTRSDSAEQGGTYDEPGRRTDGGYAGSGRESVEAGYADPEQGAGRGAPGYVEGGRSATEGAETYVSAHPEDEPGYADTGRDDRTNAGYDDVPRSDVPRDDVRSEASYTDRGTVGYADAPAGSSPAVGSSPAGGGHADQDRLVADAGYADPNRSASGAGYAEPQGGYAQGGAVPDPVRDDVRQDRGADADDAGYADPNRPSAGGGFTDPPADAGYADTGRTATPGDRDLVTSSFDPDRDSGYDPQAAGTAMTMPMTDDPGSGEVRDHGTHDHDTRDYDPASDTGYVDQGRSDVDRTVGHGDADYDTGRVDSGAGSGIGRDDDPGARGDTGRAGTAGAVVAGGAAAAAGVAAAHHRQADDDGGDRFSVVDDTATVDPTSTGRATPDTAVRDDDAPLAGVTGDAPVGTATAGQPGVGATDGGAAGAASADNRAEAVSDEADGAGDRERLVPADRAQDYSSRWDGLKGDFVDEPRRAVAQADDLVGEVLDDIQRLFSDQRRELEQGFDHDQASTEDLRLALRRYRSFFDRLLSL